MKKLIIICLFLVSLIITSCKSYDEEVKRAKELIVNYYTECNYNVKIEHKDDYTYYIDPFDDEIRGTAEHIDALNEFRSNFGDPDEQKSNNDSDKDYDFVNWKLSWFDGRVVYNITVATPHNSKHSSKETLEWIIKDK